VLTNLAVQERLQCGLHMLASIVFCHLVRAKNGVPHFVRITDINRT